MTPNEKYKADSYYDGLSGQVDEKTGVPYIPGTAGPTTSPTVGVWKRRQINRLVLNVAPLNQGRVCEVVEGALYIGIYPLEYLFEGTKKTYAGLSSGAISDNATNYVYIDVANTLQVNTSGFPTTADHLPLAEIVAANGAISSITDRRPWILFNIGATGTGTTSSTFQIDSNASGPKLKNNSGELQVRNAADNDDANLKAGLINAVDGLQKNGVALAATDLTQDSTGTTSSTFQIASGGSGPKLKNSSGELQVRNAADNDDANLKAGLINAVDGFQKNGASLGLDDLADGTTYKRVAGVDANHYVTASSAADGTWTRAKLATESLARYQLSLMAECRNADGTVLDATGAAGKFKIVAGGWGSGTLKLEGQAIQNGTEVSTLAFELALPPEYVADANVKLNISAKYDASGGGTVPTCTIDAEVYELADDGSVGADLNATAAISLTSSFADKTFTITDTNLTPGDRLMVLIRTSIQEAGNTGTLKAVLGSVEMQLDAKG
jgi:hypothetical protein